MVEEWRPIPYVEDRYEISNFGNVRSITIEFIKSDGRLQKVKGKIIKPQKPTNSCPYIRYDIKYRYPIALHRLLAAAYLGLDLNNKDQQVNHIDGNKLNNDLSNLEIVSCSENHKHAYRILGKKANKTALGKTRSKSPHSKAIRRISLNGEILKEYSCILDAVDEGYLQSGISKVINKKQKTHGGFLWEII